MAAISPSLDRVTPEPPSAYTELLRNTRGLRKEQQQAREAWLASVTVERKEELIFELEILLKGVACFANPRNHPGASRRQNVVSHDFHEHLGVAKQGIERAVQLVRTLLGQRDRAFVFQRYLETVLPEDQARSRLLRASMEQERPEDSLFVLRHALTNSIEVATGLLRLPRVTYRLFYAHLGTLIREIGHSAYWNPLAALEFRPELDRITSTQVLELIHRVRGEEAHRLVALTFLSLFRMLHYLRLVDGIASDTSDRRLFARSFLVLAVLRSDARALASYLRRRTGSSLARSFERELLAVPASELAGRHDALFAEGQRLLGLKGALSGLAANLGLEARRVYEHELPQVDSGLAEAELRARLRKATGTLRPALHGAVIFLGKSLGVSLDQASAGDMDAARATSERLRRDIWMFAQITRAFSSKARHTSPGADRWTKVASFAFVKEFLSYFRAMGYPLLRVGDYPRFDAFLRAMAALEDTDLLDPTRLARAAAECDAFHTFLTELFERISQRDELVDVPFDRKEAARVLKLYLGE